MKITVFQSDKGDCFLVEGREGGRVLVDGGMARSFTRHVAPHLNALTEAKEKLDAIYVSHIDEDHISGILQLMDDAIAWRVYDFQTTVGGNPNFKKPAVLRPPAIDRIWHNAFHEQTGDNEGEIENMLAATVVTLAGGDSKQFIQMAEFHQEVATSIRQAINLSRRIGDKQLRINLNPDAGGKLMIAKKKNSPIEIGSMKWKVIGPSIKDLEDLRKEWQEWLKENEKALAGIREAAGRTERRLGNSLANEAELIVDIASAQSEMLGQKLLSEIAAAGPKILGKRQEVTVPNLASLMFLVEEEDANGDIKTALLTGDGHHLDILKGLELIDKIKKDEPLFVDVLKVQHHGSEHNLDSEFCKRVIAKNYIFCGNGAHENPDLEVVGAILDSRLSKNHQGTHPKVGEPFNLFFNSSPANKETGEKNNAHMKKVEDLVTKRLAANPNAFEHKFLEASSFEVEA